MASLKLYTVHIKPDSGAPYDAPVFVKEGFNWWAFIFTVFWALYHGMGWVAAGIVAAFIALNGFIDLIGFGGISAEIAKIAFFVLIGFSANDWLRLRLRKKGYIIADIASGENVLRAEQRFFDRYVASKSHGAVAA